MLGWKKELGRRPVWKKKKGEGRRDGPAGWEEERGYGKGFVFSFFKTSFSFKTLSKLKFF
jgi:hypothetical protein